MCGIAGFFNLNAAPAEPQVLLRMIDLQRHRGPDDQGMRLFDLNSGRSAAIRRQNLPPPDASYAGGVGFNRLSILDLSEHGHQPMTNHDQSVFIAFNGEIYNAFDHVAELEAAGFQFRSKTDTEVILHLYEHLGFEGMLERLNGMFAIVIVDLRRQEILMARDHLGIKPFYWCLLGGVLLFSSEVKSFLAHPAFHAEIDAGHSDEYLSYRFCAGGDHLMKGVRHLKPGQMLRVKDGAISVQRYWEIPDGQAKRDCTFDDSLEMLDQTLRTCVKRQLLADVKVGCQLSGGIDSSLVSVFARSHFKADMETFSVVFDRFNSRYSEDRWISEAASAASADSHRFMFTPDFFFKSMEDATWHLDKPLNHPNSLGIYLLAQKARSQVTVLLSGEGADELLGGYMRHYYAMIHQRVAPVLPLLVHLPGIGATMERNFAPAGDPVASFLMASLFLRPSHLAQLRPDADFDAVIGKRRAIFAEGRADHFSNCLKYDMQTYMADLLVRQDKMTMAHSMENRVPFLDREMVSLIRSLPTHHLVSPAVNPFGNRARNTKRLLKTLARATFSEAFVYRPKSGFSLPLPDYYADRRFREMMEDRLLPGMINRGLVRADVVRSWWKSLFTHGRGMDEALWIPIALEIWAQKMIDGRPAAAALQE